MIGNRDREESRQRTVYVTMFHCIYPLDAKKGVLSFRSFIKRIIFQACLMLYGRLFHAAAEDVSIIRLPK